MQGRGGVSRVVVSLARNLPSLGWQLTTVTNAPPEDATAWGRERGIEVRGIDGISSAGRSYLDWRPFFRLLRLVRREHPDAVNIHYTGVAPALRDVLALRLAGARQIHASIHSGAQLGWGARLSTRIASPMVTWFVTPSEGTVGKLVASGVPARKVSPIGCAAPLPRDLDRAAIRARLGLPSDAFVVATVSRLVEYKGVATVVRATSHLEGAWLVVAGDGPEAANLHALAHPLLPGRSLFLGWVSDPADVYAAADVLALAAQHEPFGTVYAEAAMYGTPSVGSDVPGARETIVHGETGLLVPPGDVEAMTTALRALHDDPLRRQRMGAAALARARTEFTEERMAQRYDAVLRGGLARG